MELLLKTNDFREIRAGIYFLYKGKEIIYIGQSRDVSARVNDHSGSKEFDSAIAMLVPEELLDETEQYWIKRIKPKLNVQYLARAEKCPPKTKSYSITVPKTLLPVIHQMASESGRSVSGYLSHLIKQDTQSYGTICR